MDEARARRLQPHYIEGAFRAAFTRLGGKIRRREQGRFEITHVPAQLRDQRAAARSPPAMTASRSTSSTSLDEPAPAPSCSRPATRCTTPSPIEAIAPLASDAQPRHRARLTGRRGAAAARRRHRGDRRRDRDVGRPPLRLRLRRRARHRRAAGPAPYLDCVAAPADRRGHRRPGTAVAGARPRTERRAGSSPTSSPRSSARSSCAARPSSSASASRSRSRLDQENNRLVLEAMVAQEQEQAGKKPTRATRA